MPSRARDWYSVSVDTLRWTVGIAVVGVLLGGGALLYRNWGELTEEQRAYEVIDKATSLAQRLEGEAELASYRADFDRARGLVTKAEAALDQGSFDRVLTQGGEGLTILQGVQDSIRYRGQSRAIFTHVQGNVQYRRGEKGEFQRARPRDVLLEGDYVRSSSQGSAEIYFESEGTLFTLGPNALFKITRRRGLLGKTESVGVMEYGWVSLNTAQSTSGVTTKYADLQVDENSQATVSVPANSKRSRFVVRQGRAAVKSSATGEVRQLEELQQVVATGSRIAETTPVPSSPQLVDPPNNQTINIDRTDQVVLSWQEVEGAARYALQVSRGRLFAENVIDVDDRVGNHASLRIQAEGNFFWRVAARDANGVLGPWNEPAWKFRVASFGGVDLEADKTPPELKLDDVLVNGNIVIFKGLTEPGVKLAMNADPISVRADGSFSSSKLLNGQGLVDLVFRAEDEAGNVTEEVHKVFLESL